MNSNTSCLVAKLPSAVPRKTTDPSVSCSNYTQPSTDKAGAIIPHCFTGCPSKCCFVFVFIFLPECASLGTQGRCLFLKTGNFWLESVWPTSSLMMSCVRVWRVSSGMTSCLWWTASIVLWDRAEQIVSVKIKQTCPKNVPSFINTFSGERCGGFIFSFSWFTGFGHFIFGHQVVWDSQGALTDGKLKESIRQLVSWHLQQECLNSLDWKDII